MTQVVMRENASDPMDAIVQRLYELAQDPEEGQGCPLHHIPDWRWEPYTHAQVARALFQRAVAVDAPNSTGQTLLSWISTMYFFGSYQGAEDISEVRELALMLLQEGADPLAGQDEMYCTALDAFPDLAQPFLEAIALDADTDAAPLQARRLRL